MARPSLSNRRPRQGELDWNSILERAVEIVNSYDTGVTLRQLYYRLVSEGLIPNKQNNYKTLSSKSAAARREGWFPALIDRTREIERYGTMESPQEALAFARDSYRRDRTEGQEWSIYIGVEKHGLTTQLMHWFAKYGIPVLALGGYSSQTFVDDVVEDVELQGRQSVLLYAGDFDPSGMDIDRDFAERGECFDEIVRVALTDDIVRDYDLPPMPGKATDSRSARFMLEHGKLVQVELDALPPSDLQDLYQKAIDKYWDNSAYEKVVKRESRERRTIAKFIRESEMEDIDRAKQIVKGLDTKAQIADLRKALAQRAKTVKGD